MKAEKGAPQRARKAIKELVDGGAITIHVAQLNKSWGRRKGQWVAWVEQCPEDEFGFCHTASTQGLALSGLSHALHRVVHVCTKYPHKIKTAYREPGWAYATDTQEK